MTSGGRPARHEVVTPRRDWINGDSHRLFSPWHSVFLHLFLAPALLTADGQRSDAAADEMFHFAQETVGSEGAARVGVAPNSLEHGLVAGDLFERGAPLAGGIWARQAVKSKSAAPASAPQPRVAAASQWSGALDQAYSHTCLAIPARTGLSST